MDDSNKAADTVGLATFPTLGAYRVARREDPLSHSSISAPDAQTSKGNRYDVAGGGVLYCASDLEACYAETLRSHSMFR